MRRGVQRTIGFQWTPEARNLNVSHTIPIQNNGVNEIAPKQRFGSKNVSANPVPGLVVLVREADGADGAGRFPAHEKIS